ncbi:MAG TPA: hypothetical protein VL418_07305 [Devosiaceae bacterium]|jgi:hypothetical protein|nr:hypothetical protein [Devosiaceae bacterium]
MVRPLSEQLADLSVRAKNAEDTINEAREEEHEEIAARLQEARDEAEEASERVDQQIQSVNEAAASKWEAARAKLHADMTALKANVAQHQHEHDARRASQHADDLEWEAGIAVDFAIASIEQAKVAVLDAIDARVEAEHAK